MGKANRPQPPRPAKIKITEPTDLAQGFWDPRYGPEQRLEFLSEAEQVFRETGNPLFVWQAVRNCLVRKGGYPRDPLPEWVCDYLAQVSLRLGWLALGRDFTSPGGRGHTSDGKTAYSFPAWITPLQARDLLPRALGLTSRSGKSAFREAKTLSRDFLLYRFYLELLETPGMTATVALRSLLRQQPDEAADGVPRVIGGSGTPMFGFSDEASARRCIRRMRRLYPQLKPRSHRIRGA